MGQVVFTRIFGGMGQWGGAAIALDQSGNIYVAGRAGSGELLLSNALATSPSGAFIIKLSAEASTVFYSTYFPGVATITAIATDAGGNLYLTGFTSASTFPATPGLPNDTQLNGLDSYKGGRIRNEDQRGWRQDCLFRLDPW